MTPKQSLEWLKKFENFYGHTNHRVCGIDCWPIVRNTILSSINSGAVRATGRKRSFRLRSPFLIIWHFLKSLLCLIITVKNADAFVLSDNKFSETIDGKIYLNDAHAISEIVESVGGKALIALQGKSIDKMVMKKQRCFSIYVIVVISAFFSRFKIFLFLLPGVSSYTKSIANSLNEHLTSSGESGYKIEKKQLDKNIIFSIVATKLFTILLRRVNPRRAYVVCYYSVLGMSFCAACNLLKISVSDVQHGVSGRNMRAYSNWLSCPEEGYTTLPERFLTWTKYDSFAINEALDSRKGLHPAITTGPLWKLFKEKNGLDIIAKNEWCEFLSMIFYYQRKIVITLQSSTISYDFLKLIENSGSGCCFLIRAHPNFSTGTEMEDLLKVTSSYSNVFVSEPTKIPIQLLMSIGDVNITAWSASVYDAYFEGVRSVVVSRLGRDYFTEFIEAGIVFYTEDHEVLRDHAMNLTTLDLNEIEFFDFSLDLF